MEISIVSDTVSIISKINTKRIVLKQPKGTFAITPASIALLNAIEINNSIIHGKGIDWGCGIGCQGIFSAMINDLVEKIYSLEISKKDVEIAKKNVLSNNLKKKVSVINADSYIPYEYNQKIELENETGKIDFILANPPSSSNDDGLNYRRRVLKEGRRYIKNGGLVFLNISFQYGTERINKLIDEMTMYENKGIVYSSDYSEFDLNRNDLKECIYNYVENEERTKIKYEFIDINSGKCLSAKEALSQYDLYHINPTTKWQTYLFKAK